MIRYFKDNGAYFKWIDSSKSKYNILHVKIKNEGMVIVTYTMKVREDKNMEFISVYMLLDKKTQRLVDGLGRLRFKERKERLNEIKKNMEDLKINPNIIANFINDIKVTLDIR